MMNIEKLTPEEGGLDTYLPISFKNSTDREILAACIFADCNKCGLNLEPHYCINVVINDAVKELANIEDEYDVFD